MKTKLFITATFIFTFFISCDKSSDKTNSGTADIQMSELTTPEPQKTKDEKQQIPVGKFSPLANDTSVSPSPAPVNTSPDWDSKIIKTASIKLEIKDF